MLIGIIYKYTSPSCKVYIGQTTQEKRRRRTFLNLNKSYGGEKIDKARNKYFPQSFTYEVLERYKFATADEARLKLDDREAYYIKIYDSYRNGYNMTFGGLTTTGMKASEETRKKLSEMRKGRKGTPQTEERKREQSERMKALYADPEWKEKRLLIDQSPEHRRKISEKVKGEKNGMYGKKATAEARARMSASRSGEKNCRYTKHLGETHRAKVRESMREYYRSNPMSEETRNKMSKSQQIPVRQLTLDGQFVAEYPSPSVAKEKTGIDASYIVKVCKGKRPAANGYKWEYVTPCESLQSLDLNIWIGTGEAVRLTGRHRNVLKYHMDVIKDLPFKSIGKRRYIHRPTLIALYGIAS